MKKFIYCVLIALVSISCNQNDDPTLDTPFVIPQTLSAYTPELDSQVSNSKGRALCEDQAESWDEPNTVNSRTYAVIDNANPGEYIQYWSKGDAISVFFTTANQKYELSDFVDENKDGEVEKDYGHFQFVSGNTSGTSLSPDYFYSVYPYKQNTSITTDGRITYTFPNNQTYNIDSYANGENGMVAIEPEKTDNVLYFQNFCSYLQIRLLGNETASNNKVTKITLTANDPQDKIAGTGYITFTNTNTNRTPTVEMEPLAYHNNITLNCGEGVPLNIPTNENPKPEPINFWFVLPGGFTFTSGFEITVVFEDGSFYKKNTQKPISIHRNHITPMASFQVGNIKPEYGSIRYTYNSAASNGTKFPVNALFYGENNELLTITKHEFDESTGEWVILLSGPLKRIGGNIFEPKGSQSKYPNIATITIESNDSIVIDDYAFYKCTADKIDITADIKTVGASAFAYCTATEINIYGGITTIEEDGFISCNKLEQINISSGITHIGNNAFRDLDDLTSINLNGVETIGYAAFQGCMGLESIVIPSTCISIGEGAFVATSIYEITCLPTTPPSILTDNTTGDAYIFEKGSEVFVPAEAINTYQTTMYWNLLDDSGVNYAYTYLPIVNN